MNIATTVTKDNICASGKEGIKGNDQTDNRTSLCKPEDLFLAFAHIENKLARAWLHKFDEGKKILIDPIATLSEHHVSDNDKGYATLDCFIFMDSFGAGNGTRPIKAQVTRIAIFLPVFFILKTNRYHD